MTPERRARIDAVFEAALERPPAERERWLAAECGEDDALRAEVRALLAAHERTAGVLDVDPTAMRAAASDPIRNRRVGPYRLLRELGRGGMGVVYLAERDDGQFRRRVALKLLREGPDGEELHRRFLAERQILASLDHPNIAQLLDGGVTDGRLPFLVMEYVEGQPITEYCDRQRLGLRERLRLFQDVCAAVHHAHQNLIIHRDLKPSNVLVTPASQVKLLDFGIAKLLNPGASGVVAPVTRTRFRVMTPEYASPEQVRGDPLTTASDVYALGVLLYELLTGHSPYGRASTSAPELYQAVIEHEPSRPSTRVGATGAVTLEDGTTRPITPESVSAARGLSPERLRRELRGDLDAIVLMALRKEPRRRFGSADLLAQDIQRYLEGLPVLAHRGSRAYRVGKLLRRHRVAAIAAAVGAIALVGGAGAATWQAVEAHRERERADQARVAAEHARRQAEEVSDFLMGLFGAVDPGTARGADITAREMLERGIERAELLADEPVVQARMFGVVGRVLGSLGEYDRAETLLHRALALRRAELGSEHVDIAESLDDLASLLVSREEFDAAETLFREALEMERRLLGDGHPRVAKTLRGLALVHHRRGEYESAEASYREALSIQRNGLGEADPDAISTMLRLAALIRDRGDREGAGVLLRQVLELQHQVLGPDHPELAQTYSHLASIHAGRGEYAEAEELFRSALEIRRRVLGPDHPDVASSMSQVAAAMQFQGRLEDAEPLFREALAVLRRTVGPDHTRIANGLNSLGLLLRNRGDLEEAESVFREAVDMYRRLLGAEHPNLATALHNLANVRADRGSLAEAEELHSRALAMRRATLGANHSYVAASMIYLAGVRHRRGQYEAAEAQYEELLTTFHDALGDDHHSIRRAYRGLADLYDDWGRPEAAQRFRALAEPPG